MQKRKRPVPKGCSYMCPRCQIPTRIIAIRHIGSRLARRYRECENCKFAITTLEKPEDEKES
jgi:transcriptional regulator NrdR family protein